MQIEFRKPYRIVVFASAPVEQSKRARSKTTVQLRDYAYMGWNCGATQSAMLAQMNQRRSNASVPRIPRPPNGILVSSHG
jgi:hypothetical protein